MDKMLVLLPQDKKPGFFFCHLNTEMFQTDILCQTLQNSQLGVY